MRSRARSTAAGLQIGRAGRDAATRVKLMRWFFLLAVFFSALVRGDDWLVAPLTSYHFDRAADYNERNFGLGIEHDIAADWRAVAGAYHNSDSRLTVYVGALWIPLESGNVKAGLLICGATGYGHLKGAGVVLPIVAPAVMYEGRQFGANLIFLPGDAIGAGNVVGFQIKWRF